MTAGVLKQDSNTLKIRKKHYLLGEKTMQIIGLIPFIKLQSDTQTLKQQFKPVTSSTSNKKSVWMFAKWKKKKKKKKREKKRRRKKPYAKMTQNNMTRKHHGEDEN